MTDETPEDMAVTITCTHPVCGTHVTVVNTAADPEAAAIAEAVMRRGGAPEEWATNYVPLISEGEVPAPAPARQQARKR